jgi:hypothetical protein
MATIQEVQDTIYRDGAEFVRRILALPNLNACHFDQEAVLLPLQCSHMLQDPTTLNLQLALREHWSLPRSASSLQKK